MNSDKAPNMESKIAAVMAPPVFLDLAASIDKAVKLIEEAANKGANLIAFPEAFLPGYPYWIWFKTPTQSMPYFQKLYKNAMEADGPASKKIADAAERTGTFVVMGCSERDGGTLYNTLLFYGPEGNLIGRHRKLQPTNVERTVWGVGDGSDLNVYDTPFGKVGGLICWEHSMDLARYALISMGEQIHIGAWPGGSAISHNPRSIYWNDMAESMQKSHAITGQTFVVSVQSPVGADTLDVLGLDKDNPDLQTGGGWTAIINPWGQVIAGPMENEEGILYADINLADIQGIKYLCDSAGHYARPDVLQLGIDRTPKKVTNSLKQEKP
jgi:aliphatic nitrilase